MVTRKVLTVDKHDAQKIRKYLESNHLFDKSNKIQIDENKARIPIVNSDDHIIDRFVDSFGYRPVIEDVCIKGKQLIYYILAFNLVRRSK